MNLFRSIVFASVIAGVVVGAVITVIQQFGTVPLILKAEMFEKASVAHASAPADSAAQPAVADHHHDHDHAAHDHGAEAWEPHDGLERTAYTAGANVLTGVGFALVLAAFFAIRGGATGTTISWHEGLLWGLAGFVVFTLAPGLGLPPELPGVPTAPLLSRQIWWVFTAVATAGGLSLILLRRSIPAAVAGLILLVLPHLIGAPELAQTETNVPSSLSHQFVVAVTMTSLVFWAMLGGLTSLALAYFEQASLKTATA